MVGIAVKIDSASSRAISSVWLERVTDNDEVPGSSPGSPTSKFLRGCSSVGLEHLLCKQGVEGSSPSISTR